MTPKQSLLYTIRQETPAHKDSLTNYIAADGREFVTLSERIFSTLPAVSTGPKYSGALDAEMDWIAKCFYTDNSKYRVPKLRRGYDSEMLFDPEVILQREAPGNSTTGHNRSLTFLLGDVGVGKSSLINYLISVHLSRLVEAKKAWFCRIDIERKSDIGHFIRPEFSVSNQLINMGTKICWISEHYIHPELTKLDQPILGNLQAALRSACSPPENAPPPLPQTIALAIRGVLEFIAAKTGREFFLILDNIDYIGHINDRLKFTGEPDPVESRTLKSAIALIQLIHSGQLFGSAPAKAIVAIRQETHELIDTYQGTSFSSPFPDSTFYTVETIDAEMAVKLRCDLLREAAARRIAGTNKAHQYEQIQRWVAVIESYLGLDQPRGRGNRLIDELSALSNHGLRSILDHVGKYTIAPFFSLASRLGEEPSEIDVHHKIHRARILFMLGRRLRFSQAKSHFPNLYLAVKLHREDQGRVVSHCHSYWLKRLLFEYLHKNKCTTIQQVMAMFCVEDDGYEPFMVRELLGSLYEANSSAVISARRSYAGTGGILSILHVEMLTRGKHIKTNILDTFAYLQMVIDDYMLPIPKFLQDELGFEGRQDYRYLMHSDHKFGNTASMLRQKIVHVIILLDILAVSLEIEQEFRSKTFERLRSDGGIDLPNVGSVRRDILREFEAIKEKVHGGNLGVDTENDQARDDRVERLRTFFRRSMRDGFSDVSKLKQEKPELFRIEDHSAH